MAKGRTRTIGGRALRDVLSPKRGSASEETARHGDAPSVSYMGRAPRVLHIITRLIRGGADENTILTVNGLARMGHRCMLAYGRQSEAAEMERASGVETYLVPSMVRAVRPIGDSCALGSLISLMRRFKPDIVHTHTAKAGVLGRIAAWAARCPVVIHGLHGTTFHPGQSWPVRRAIIRLERMLAPLTTAYMSVSTELSELYLSERIGQPEQYVTVRSGMDLSAFEAVTDWGPAEVRAKKTELGLPAQLPLAVMVCRLEPRKRVDRLIHAAAQLKQAGLKACFAIAGEGPSRDALEALVTQLDVEDSVHFLGFREDVPEVLAASSAVCLTSAWEGLPRAFIQARIVGRMIVCFDVNGAHEAVTDGVNGFIAPQDDPDMFCRRLREALENGTCARAGDETVGCDSIQRWNADTMVAETNSVYQRLLEGSPVSETDK